MPILYRRPRGAVNNHEKPQRSAFKEHAETRNPQIGTAGGPPSEAAAHQDFSWKTKVSSIMHW
jgi:hypothetical protein